MSDLNVLLEPYELPHFTLKNRVVSTAHAPSYAVKSMPMERYQLYHEEKAKGGTSLTMFGGSSTISPDCPPSFGQVDVSRDEVIPYFKEFSARIHKYDCKIMCQIAHMGRRSRWDKGYWLPNVSPSPIREPEHRSFPKEMEEWDIERIIADYGRAALRCREGGLDGIELSFNSMQLVALFWSPHSNTRNDHWGGSLENRMRFGNRVIEEVRKQVGADFHVGLRMPGDELYKEGLSQEDCIEIGKLLARNGNIDHISIAGGAPLDYRNMAIQMPGMAFPEAPCLDMATAFKKEVNDVCVIHAQRITSVHTAARILSEGRADLIGMVRAQMADPYLVKKIVENKVDDIRPCVGANYCTDRIYIGGESLCTLNPATSRESSLPHNISKAPSRKKIVVVGAGPAGLEAARVCGLRGHEVVLFEKNSEVGGQINLAKRASWRGELAGVSNWLYEQVKKLGVDIRLGIPAKLDDVLAENPDVVIIATGGKPNKGIINGDELVDSSRDILANKVDVKENVLFFDNHGGHQGLCCAEILIEQCEQLEIVTPDRYLGAEIGATNFPIHYREIYKSKTIISPNLRLMGVHKEEDKLAALLRNEYTLNEEKRIVDQVVSEHGVLPNDDLYFELLPVSRNKGEFDLDKLAYENILEARVRDDSASFDVYRIGDALAGRNIHAAIYDGLRYCKDF